MTKTEFKQKREAKLCSPAPGNATSKCVKLGKTTTVKN